MTFSAKRRRARSTPLALLSGLSLLGLGAGCENGGAREGEAPAADPAPLSPLSARAPVHVPLKTGFVRLTNRIHPFARPEYDDGRLDPEQRIENLSLYFKLSPEQRRDRDALVAAQLDESSPSFRHWLTPEDYASRFGATQGDIERVSAWLGAQGLTVHRTSRLGSRVSFSAKVGDLEAAFQTEMHRYVVNGETHYAMATAPAFPAALADVVLALHNTHDFYKRPVSNLEPLAMASRGARFNVAPDGGPDGGPLNALGPPDWAAAYDVAKLYSPGIGGKELDGAGVTIGIVGTAQIAQSDIDAFRKTFDLPPTTVTMTLVPDTGAGAAGRRNSGLEAILDTEWSGAIAKGATVNYVYVGANDRNVDDATTYIIEENLASVLSESYGGCEAGALPSDADVLEVNGTAANLLGITYMAASGDTGASDCGGPLEGGSGLFVDMPGSFPGVTSVGGTEFPSLAWTASGDLHEYPSLEQVWNESNDPFSMGALASGGGGISSIFPRPLYQDSVGACVPLGALPFAGNPSGMRQVPDVAFSAAVATPGYFVACTFSGADCSATGGSPEGTVVGGTSASAPSFSGVVAILSQAIGARLGNINPLLYGLQAKAVTPAPFHDITAGNNEIVCGAAAADAGGPTNGAWQADAGCFANGLYGFPATPGYDCASGLGSVDGYNLVSALIGVSKTTTALVASPTEIREGGTVTLKALVSTVGANPATLTGAVTFAFESFTETGALDLSWELGTVPVSIAAGAATADATLETAIPPGLVKPGHQWVDVVAIYDGDTKHLGSRSPFVGIGFAPISFAVDPEVTTMEPNATKTFTTTGGIPPVRWYVNIDSTHGRTDAGSGAAEFGDGGTLSVGPKAGYVEIAALDSDGAEALAYITVGAPTTGVPWSPDAGPFLDSGVPPIATDAALPVDGGDAGDAGVHDAGKGSTTPPGDAAAKKDGATVDAGPPELSQGGCRCEAPGVHVRSGSGTPTGAIAAFAFGLALAARRRRRSEGAPERAIDGRHRTHS